MVNVGGIHLDSCDQEIPCYGFEIPSLCLWIITQLQLSQVHVFRTYFLKIHSNITLAVPGAISPAVSSRNILQSELCMILLACAFHTNRPYLGFRSNHLVEDSTLHNHRDENRRSYIIIWYIAK
jgi:hypothetical protein